ncbi:MAG: hypothetical protein ACRD22_13515 [Terriglobia bacterium]
MADTGLRRSIAAVAGCLLALAFLAPPARAAEARAPEPTVEQYDAQVAALLKKLSDDDLWTAPDRSAELAAVLAAAARVASLKLLPPLIKHIGYEAPPNPNYLGKRRPGQLNPALAVITRIGAPAIAALVEGIEHAPKTDNAAHLDADAGCMVLALYEIYNRGGYGVELTRERIILALSATTDPQQKANLQAALDLPILKVQTKD